MNTYDMNTISFPQTENSGKEQALPEGVQENIYPNRYEINKTDGGEFLDDGIRMKDQPFEEPPMKTTE